MRWFTRRLQHGPGRESLPTHTDGPVTDDVARREARTGFGDGESITAYGAGPGATA